MNNSTTLFLWGMGLVSLVFVLCVISWGLWRVLARSEDPARLLVKWVVTVILAGLIVWSAKLGPFGVPAVAVLGVILGIMWAPNLGAMLASPLTSLFDGGGREIEPAPLYSIAIAKRKMGHYQESIAEIQKQLARFPADFEGMLMLAEIYAEELKDSIRAYGIVEEILASEGRLPQHVAYALNRAADWRLKYDRDPAAARQTLERILELCPDTEQAQLTRQRIAHLASEEVLRDQAEPHRIALRSFQDNIGLQSRVESIAPAEEDPATVAHRYLQHLELHPQDNETREKLALVYADQFQRLDLATAQLEALIEAPNQLPKHVVHWLNLMADLQIRLGGDVESARRTLQRIVNRFPKSASAESAQSRMAYLKLEARKITTNQAVKLGSYDQNIGLKYGPPASSGEPPE